ncbi:hypothetical protein EV702DRAFT_1153486 [Suillus placidus]|uniref:F-box domain-containing protein n=1 Tax=Suillus placidus TaxID=48579 RepID=A0A9P7CW57_9AGAM|nr:hypothetical protein EV702DRAFT_1153486 [Suillus placidus]
MPSTNSNIHLSGLPTEVLSRIFQYCLPPLHDVAVRFSDISLPSSRLQAPLLLTTICQQWREIVVGMPSLWCRVLVEVNSGDWPRRAFYYDLCLKRSQGCPLSLALLWPDCASDSAKLESLLQPYISQITSLTLDIYDSPEVFEFCTFKGFAAVKHLFIRVAEEMEDEVSGVIRTSAATHLPALQSFRYAGKLIFIEELQSYDPMFQSLTEVDIHTGYHDAALELLRLAPNLCSLTVSTYLGEDQDLEPFTHIKLQHLHIHLDVDALEDLLDILTLPNLRTLEVHGVETWPHAAFKAFLKCSGCPLGSLMVGGLARMTAKQRAVYKRLIPSLQFPVLVRGPQYITDFNIR